MDTLYQPFLYLLQTPCYYGVGVSYDFLVFLTIFFLEVFLAVLLVGVEMPFASLDFNLEALLGWIRCTLAALSRAEKTACKLAGVFCNLAFLIKVLSWSFRFLLRRVLTRSFLIFLMADLMIGIYVGNVNIVSSLAQSVSVQFELWLKIFLSCSLPNRPPFFPAP